MDLLEMEFGSEYDYNSITLSQALQLGFYRVDEHVRRICLMHFKKEADLQTMCLNVIVDHIGKFVKRWSKWKDEPQRIEIELLRRVYPDRLYRMLKKRESYFTSGILDLLLTRYWNRVTLFRFDYSHTGLFRRLKTVGKTITSLTLQDSTASSDMLTAIICCVPNVVYLNLVGTDCNDSVLALISKMCKSLVTLNLRECRKVTDEGISHLYNLDREEIGFNSLKALNINGTRITEESVPFILKYLTSLEYLKYTIVSILLYDLYIHNCLRGKDIYNLTSFEYNQSSVYDRLPRYNNINVNQVLRVWTRLCPKVTRICVREIVDEEFLQLCSQFEHLKVLKLTNEHYNLLALSSTEFFRLRASQLTEIHLNSVLISVDILTELCAKLKKLTLDRVTFGDFDVCAASVDENRLNELEFLTLSHVDFKEKVTYKSFEILLNFSKNLTKLAITYSSNFHEDVVACILNSPNLTELNFSFTDVTSEMLCMFFASETINHICTDGCPYIPRKCESSLSRVNDNPHGNTCGWKIDFSYLDDIEDEKWTMKTPWAGDISI